MPTNYWYHVKVNCQRGHTIISRSYNNSSSGANSTPYSGVNFWGVILTPKRSLKNSFSGVKVTPDIEELKKKKKRSYPVPKIFTSLSELN